MYSAYKLKKQGDNIHFDILLSQFGTSLEQNISGSVAAAKSLQLCLTLCDPIDGSLPGSPIPGILQARTLGWVAISFFFVWKWKVKVKLLSHVQLLATPWTLPGPHEPYQAPPSMGIFQASVLEWVAIAFSMSGSNCCLLTCIQISQEAGQVVWYPICLRIFHSLWWSTQSKALGSQ